MTSMMEGLLTLARSDSGRLETDRTLFDFKKMARTTMEAFRLLADQQQIYLSGDIDMQDSDGMFYGYEERLKQLLYILLDNVVKFSKPGGKIHLELIVLVPVTPRYMSSFVESEKQGQTPIN